MSKLEAAKAAARKAFRFEVVDKNFREAKIWWGVAYEKFKVVGDGKSSQIARGKVDHCAILDDEEE